MVARVLRSRSGTACAILTAMENTSSISPTAEAPERVAVLCIGNPLMLDDGVGPRIARELVEGYEFPEGVEVLDEGCMGLALLPVLDENDFVLVVDAVDAPELEPGTVVRFRPEDIGSYHDTIRSAHDMRFVDVLQAATLLGYEVDGLCIGVQAANPTPSEPCIALTPAVEAAIPLAIQTVLATLVQQGVDGITSKETGESVVPEGAFAADGASAAMPSDDARAVAHAHADTPTTADGDASAADAGE